MKSGLLDAIAYQSTSPCEYNISEYVEAIFMQFSFLITCQHAAGNKKKNQWEKRDFLTAKVC